MALRWRKHTISSSSVASDIAGYQVEVWRAQTLHSHPYFVQGPYSGGVQQRRPRYSASRWRWYCLYGMTLYMSKIGLREGESCRQECR